MKKPGSLLKRTLTALVFLAVMLACFRWRSVYCIVFPLLVILMTCEFNRLVLPAGKYMAERVCVIVSGVSIFLLSYLWLQHGLNPAFVALSALPVVAAFIFMMFDCCEKYDFDGNIFFPLVYVALPLSSVNWLVSGADGGFNGALLFFVFGIIWLNDVGAYAIGMSLGQKPDSKKLFPALSPKKSWAGFAGGALFSLIAAVLVWLMSGWLHSGESISLTDWFVIALIITVFGICGDLFESLIKRHAAVKDSGNILPGHGGMLDRFDAALFALPVVTLFIKLLDLI